MSATLSIYPADRSHELAHPLVIVSNRDRGFQIRKPSAPIRHQKYRLQFYRDHPTVAVSAGRWQAVGPFWNGDDYLDSPPYATAHVIIRPDLWVYVDWWGAREFPLDLAADSSAGWQEEIMSRGLHVLRDYETRGKFRFTSYAKAFSSFH